MEARCSRARLHGNILNSGPWAHCSIYSHISPDIARVRTHPIAIFSEDEWRRSVNSSVLRRLRFRRKKSSISSASKNSSLSVSDCTSAS